MRQDSYLGRLLVLSYGEDHAIVTLKAFVDDSGSIDDPQIRAISIGGCVAPLESWTAFEPRWKAVLSAFGVTHLHMKDYAHFRGDFTVFRQSRERQRDFLKQLMDVLDDTMVLLCESAHLWHGTALAARTGSVSTR